MQHASVYLYLNIVDVYVNPINSNLLETFNKVYNRNLKIVRGIENTIELRIKNSDQRPANIGINTYLVFNLIDSGDQQHVFQKDCLIKDVAAGIASITLTEQELDAIDGGFYDYNLVLETREYVESGSEEYIVTKRRPTYTDTMFDVKGTAEVLANINGYAQSSTLINTFQYFNPVYTGLNTPAYYISSLINANTEITRTLHTFQFYFDDFEGEVIIQASNDEQGATPHNWAEVDSFNSLGVNEFRNVKGKFTWFRIKYIPVTLPNLPAYYNDLQPAPNHYKINKVLYR